MENKRIPFDWEKYQSGEYEVICKNGDKPEQLTRNPNARTNSELIFWVNGEAHALSIKGFLVGYDDDKHHLFLIPKPKKFQAWVNLYSDGLSLNYRSEYMAKELVDVHLENGREFIETRLIEWEG
jgi:hypothetical protein